MDKQGLIEELMQVINREVEAVKIEPQEQDDAEDSIMSTVVPMGLEEVKHGEALRFELGQLIDKFLTNAG